MAFASSYVNGYHLGQMLINAAAYNLDADTIRVSLYTSSIGTMNKNANELKGSSPFNANEVSYTGATPSSAGTLTDPTVSVGSGILKFSDSSPTMVWTGATFITAGAVLWDDTLTSPADPVICALNFGSDLEVVGGTFTITWDSTYGIFYGSY